MAGLLDLDLSAADPGALYNGLLSPQQDKALAYRGLLAAAGALGQAAMPSRLPVPLGAALGQAAGAMGSAQDQAAMNAMRGNLLGLQGQQLAWRMRLGNQLLSSLNNGGAVPSGPPGQPAGQPQGLLAQPGSATGNGVSAVPPGLQQAVLQIESGGRLNPPDSKAGAIGPGQVMPATGAQYGVSPQQLRDPSVNVAVSGAYLGDLSKRYNGDPDAIAVGYNAGPKVADRWLQSGRDPSVLPAETRGYLDKLHLIMPQGGTSGAGALPQIPDMSGSMRTIALSDLAGFPALGQAIMNSPQWQAATEAAKTQAALPAQYAAPGANPALQQQLAAAKARGAYSGPEADVGLQSHLASAKAAAQFAGPAGVGDLRQGGTAYNKRTGQPIYAAPFPREEVDKQGNTHWEFVYPPGAPNAPGAPTAQGGGAGGAGNAAAPAGPLAKLSPQRAEELKGVGEEAAKTREENIDAATAAQAQQSSLMTLKSEAPQFYTGPFAEHVQQAKSFMRLLPGGDALANQVASYEDFNKNAGALVRQAVREQSPRAAVQEFRLITEQLPNPEMSPAGLGRVVNELMGLNDYRIAKSQAQQQWENRPGSSGVGDVSGFETDWQQKVSPYAFLVGRMEPVDRQRLFGQLAQTDAGKNELQHLAQQIKYIQMQGLDQFR